MMRGGLILKMAAGPFAGEGRKELRNPKTSEGVMYATLKHRTGPIRDFVQALFSGEVDRLIFNRP